MTIQVRCNCGQVYGVADEMAGQQAKCQVCNMVFQVPVPNLSQPTTQQATTQQQPSVQQPYQNPQQPNPNAGPQHGSGAPIGGGVPGGQMSHQPFAGLQEPPPQAMGYPQNQYPGQPNANGQNGDEEMSPQKAWLIIGGGVGGLIVLIMLVSFMMPGKGRSPRRVNRQSTHDVVQTPFWTRVITSGVAGVIGLGLCLVGAEEFRTKKAEEVGRARLTNKLLGRSNHYEGRAAEWAGIVKIISGVGSMIFAIYFFFNGAG